MKRRILIFKIIVPLFSFLTFLLSAASLYSAFEINKLGARASAFNDAYSSLAGDGWGLLYNPAQVVRLEGFQAAIGYSRPHLNFGNFQANLVSGFLTKEALGTGYGLGVVFVDTNLFYREIIGIFNLGHRIGETEDSWDFSLGANLKILSLRRGDPAKPYDPALVQQTMNRFTADLGTHIRFQNLFLGVAAQNVVPANFGVVVRDPIPMETRIGVGAKELWEIPNINFKVSPTFEIANRNKDTTAAGAVEVQLFDFASFIFGAGTRNLTFGFSVFLNPPGNHRPAHSKKELYVREKTLYRLDVGYLYPISGVDSVGSPLLGMNFIF